MLVLTDGQDQSPGGAAGEEIEKKKLIEAAKAAGVVIHSIGYAESADAQRFFLALKEIAAQTDGLFEAAVLATKEVPASKLTLMREVMHGAGTAHIDVSKLADSAALVLTVKTAAGKTAVLDVPHEKVKDLMDEIKRLATAKVEVKDDEPPKEAPPVVKTEFVPMKTNFGNTIETDAVAAKNRILIAASFAVVVVLAIVAVLLIVRASRKRAAKEALLAEEERAAREARRRAEETKKSEAPALAWLEMCDAQQTRHPVRIPSLKIGRGQHNDLTLRNDSVSGNHCVLNCNREKEWSITDLNSGNGVILNGERVVQATLRHGDVIELGELKMRFLLHV